MSIWSDLGALVCVPCEAAACGPVCCASGDCCGADVFCAGDVEPAALRTEFSTVSSRLNAFKMPCSILVCSSSRVETCSVLSEIAFVSSAHLLRKASFSACSCETVLVSVPIFSTAFSTFFFNNRTGAREIILLCLQCVFCYFNNCFECGWIFNCHVAQSLAVESDTCFCKTVDKAAV